jgi:hypothetical protein
MPDKETLEKAERDKRKGKAPTTQAGEFIREEIRHIREGKHGAESAKQAIAIGLAKARRAGVDLPLPEKGTVPEKSRTRAKRDRARGQRAPARRKPSARRSRATLQVLKRIGRSAASREALARHARSAASRRSGAERSASARKAARIKCPARRAAAARQAARTRKSSRK